jgi:hypothetical protein
MNVLLKFAVTISHFLLFRSSTAQAESFLFNRYFMQGYLSLKKPEFLKKKGYKSYFFKLTDGNLLCLKDEKSNEVEETFKLDKGTDFSLINLLCFFF